MTPEQAARALFEQQHFWMDWEELTRLYSGWPRLLISTSEAFLMARPVKWADQEGIATEKVWHIELCDTWFIWLFVGRVGSLHDLLPYSLPQVCWRKMNNSLHLHSSDRLKRLVKPLAGH